MKFSWRLQSLKSLISAILLMFGGMLALSLTVQGQLSQALVEHPIWKQVLESSTRTFLQSSHTDLQEVLPTSGPLRGWLIVDPSTPPAGMPAYLGTLAPGFYSEGEIEAIAEPGVFAGVLGILTPRWGPFADDPSNNTRARNYSVLVTLLPHGKLVMAIDITDLEDEQNASVQLGVMFLIFNLIMIGMVIWWLHVSLTRPIEDLAKRMRKLDPLQPSQRVPVTYKKSELNVIASEANAHLERVERALDRERSLLDQASHEFRTPLAIISGAADVLHKQALPDRAQRPLNRIDEAVETLTEIMEALLYLSREPNPEEREQVTNLHELLPELVRDHSYLLGNKPVDFVTTARGPAVVRAPESMVRIAVGNLLRNAAEHTHEGIIRVSLAKGSLTICDSGSGFDTMQVARRYTESLKQEGRRPGGSGLGLFLTQRICERFNWRLHLESSPTTGTSATIDFGLTGADESGTLVQAASTGRREG